MVSKGECNCSPTIKDEFDRSKNQVMVGEEEGPVDVG